MLFDSLFTFESKLGWHRLFLTVESTRGIRTLVVVFELMEEMVAWGCRNGRFNEKFQILPLELKVKFIWMLLYVFLTVLDLPPRFIAATLHVDKSLKMGRLEKPETGIRNRNGNGNRNRNRNRKQ